MGGLIIGGFPQTQGGCPYYRGLPQTYSVGVLIIGGFPQTYRVSGHIVGIPSDTEGWWSYDEGGFPEREGGCPYHRGFPQT